MLGNSERKKILFSNGVIYRCPIRTIYTLVCTVIGC